MGEALKALPQPCFEVELGTAPDGSPTETPLSSTSNNSNSSFSRASLSNSPRKRTILVCFVGGCTHAEVSALRWLSSSAAGRAAVAALQNSSSSSRGGGSSSSSSSVPPSSSSSLPEFQFVIATSAMLTGDELIRSFDPPAVAGLRATVAAV